MPTFRERLGSLFLGDKLGELEHNIGHLQEVNQRLYNAYLSGPYELPPDELLRQFKSFAEYYDPALVADLVDRMNWEQVSGYGGYSEDERRRAVDDSKRMFKYAIIARWIVNLWTYYGMGVNVSIIAEDEAADEIWQDFWAADRNQRVIAKDRMDELSRWLLVTGERFHVFFSSTLDGETTIRNVEPGQITSILTNPDDSTEPWFYERQRIVKGGVQTLYYPDWELFFNGDVAKTWRTAQREYTINGELAQQNQTAACMLFTPFVQLDEENLRGWPLLAPQGTPWLRAQREFMQDRATVTRGKAAYIRRYQVSGGSRGVASVQRTLASAFQFGGTSETNPPPTAGSSEVHNRAVDVTDLPMTTGAGDAKSDGEMFAWMAGLAGGVFPHYLGLGDAYRLATATSMEVPLNMQFSLYRNQLGAMLRKMVRIVLQYQERYNKAKFETYAADVSTDRLVENDLALISGAAGQVYRDILTPLQALGDGIPPESREQINVFMLQKVLEAMGAQDVQDIISLEQYEREPEAQEAGLSEQHPGPTPRGQPLPPWEGQVEITAEDVAEAIVRWNEEADPEFKGLLETEIEQPEGGEVEEGNPHHEPTGSPRGGQFAKKGQGKG